MADRQNKHSLRRRRPLPKEYEIDERMMQFYEGGSENHLRTELSNAQKEKEMQAGIKGCWARLRYGWQYHLHKTISVFIAMLLAGATVYLKSQTIDFMKAFEDTNDMTYHI